MATPINEAPKNNQTTLPKGRINNPILKMIKEAKIVRSIENTFDIFGIIPESSAKHNNGRVVTIPACILFKERASLISPITGPTLVSGARKLEATKSTAKKIII